MKKNLLVLAFVPFMIGSLCQAAQPSSALVLAPSKSKSLVKKSASSVVEEDYSALDELFKEEEKKESTLKKPISKMTSREIAQLKYDNLSEKDQQEIFTIALFSGLEAHRSAAREVIGAYRATKNIEKLSWDKQLSNLSQSIFDKMNKAHNVKSESKLKKPMSKMTSREIGALEYEDLTPEEERKLWEMAILSGLEDYRSVARKVIDVFHKAINGKKPIDWQKDVETLQSRISQNMVESLVVPYQKKLTSTDLYIE